jgi:N-acetylglucosaminyl-diphospho-decaprenol L-rhamnosyltransferase
VRKPSGDVQRIMIRARQHNADPPTEMRRANADVHRDVEHFTLRHTAQFGLRMAKLVVQSTQNPARGVGVIVLDKGIVNAGCCQGIGAVTLKEESARVFEDTRFDQEYSGKGCLDNLQAGPQELRTGEAPQRQMLVRKEDYNPWFLLMPRCSVIIVTYNSGAQVEECLSALASQKCEIIVVDNDSQDDTVARVKAVSQKTSLQVVSMSRNLGFAEGANQGVHAATGDVVLLLNPDAVAEPGAINAMVSCFAETGASVVGGALLGRDGQPAKGFAFRRIPTLTSLLFEVLLVNQAWPGNPVNRRYRCLDADYSIQQLIEQPAGACLAVTLAAWESVQGMDPAFYPVWFEDVDLCKRLFDRGAKIVYCPSARFHHTGAHSVGQMEFGDKQMVWYQNMVRYAAKHFSAAKVLILRIAIFKGMVLRILVSLFGGGPRNLPPGEPRRSYARVAAWTIGLEDRRKKGGKG